LEFGMNREQWSSPTSDGIAARRAGGRRRIKAWRRFNALHRRMQLSTLLKAVGLGHGWKTEAAKRLGVSRRTVGRDQDVIRQDTWVQWWERSER
jgi:DNA invertase Pin-like site-specific DNA recombinase